MSPDEVLLLDMLLACEKIARFFLGVDGTAFLKNMKHHSTTPVT